MRRAAVSADQAVARRRFCAKPFRHLEVVPNGDAYLCCPGWMPRSVGNVRQEPIASIWNGARAQEVRRSILDGSFVHCRHCPLLGPVVGSVRYVDAVDDPEERALLETGAVVTDRIAWLNLAYDRTCNLSCPSCRTELFVAADTVHRQLHVLQETVLAGDILDRVDWLYVSGSGEPFASRLFRDLLRSLEPTRYDRLRIKLHTNALLFSPAVWDDLGPIRARVQEVEVSIDAACESTYRFNRRGGDWSQLLERLAFVSTLRGSGPVRRLQFSFVVQANNWREMPAFVEFAEAHGADRVLFTPLQSWNTFSADELAERTVHDPRHPEHAAFIESLSDPRLSRSMVTMGWLAGQSQEH